MMFYLFDTFDQVLTRLDLLYWKLDYFSRSYFIRIIKSLFIQYYPHDIC